MTDSIDHFLEPEGHLFVNGCFNWMMNQIFIYLVVEPTHLKKYARQIASFPQTVKNKNIWNNLGHVMYFGGNFLGKSLKHSV